MYLLGATTVGAALWAYMTPIDISVRSRGIVRPEGEPIRIAAEVGGSIRRINVAEGDLVNAHQPLLELDFRDNAAVAAPRAKARDYTGEPAKPAGGSKCWLVRDKTNALMATLNPAGLLRLLLSVT